MKFRRTLGVAVATIALGMVSVPQAFAAPDHWMYSDDTIFPGEDPGGKVEFTEHGDIVKLCDNDADGYAAYVFVYDGELYGRAEYVLRAGGEGNCTTVRASDGGVYNLPERKISFLICVGKTQEGSGYCDGASWVNDH